ncbi:MAG TPA: TerC family protein [Coriobacteriia bacterium]|nr:TerC family protein [Coriobacteriia bacterium]
MAEIFTIQSLVALVTLTILELVLGVDNIIFLAIVTENVPDDKKDFVRKLGLSLALVGRIVMVLGISWLLQLDSTLFTIMGHGFSAEDMILIAGGIFLTYKAVTEIYKETELKEEEHTAEKSAADVGKGALAGVIAQIVVVDLVFAIDSVLTAVGLTQQYVLIIIAMTIAILAMMFFAKPLSDFIHEHPSLKMLALSFLVLIGVLLLADGFGEEIDRNYVYAAILFSLGVEALNFRRTANLQRQKRLQGPTGV